MNFVEFVDGKGICKTAAGHKIHDLKITEDNNYPIIGKIEWSNGFLMNMCWNKEGFPINLPLNHGLNLMAMVPRVVFERVSISDINKEIA